MNSTNNLINSLVADHRPKTLPKPWIRALIWSVAVYAFVVAEFYFTGEFRNGWIQQVISSPGFAAELFIAIAASAIASFMAFDSAIPHTNHWKSARFWLPVAGLGVVLALLLYGLYNPSLAPTMAGKRDGCIYQTALFSIVPLAFGIYLIRTSAPIRPYYSGMLISLGACLPAASLMHIACMYDPAHILERHFTPVILLTLAVVGVSGRLFRW